MLNVIGHGDISLREAFGQALVDLAETYDFIVLDADVAGGTGTYLFRDKYPDRFIQCGISEQNMMGVAAGLSISTGKPIFVTCFATFALRAYEIARLSIDYPRRNIKVVCSHGGLDTGPDGHSAQCFEDLACWRALSNFIVLSPSSPNQIKQATKSILDYDGPVYMRTGRSPIHDIGFEGNFAIGKGYVLREGSDIALVCCGKMTYYATLVQRALEKWHNIHATVIDMPTIKPIDKDLIFSLRDKVNFICTLEDHSIYGGLGSAVCEVMCESRVPLPVYRFGMSTCGQSGEADALMDIYELDAKNIVSRVLKICELY